jgi:palmitoyltransferase ZDHHC3/7/25
MNDADYYEDTVNEEPFACTFGTSEDHGIWLNHRDRVGTVVAMTVWLLYCYCGFTILLLAQHGDCPVLLAVLQITICTLALSCHVKTMMTDPGAIPAAALPLVTKNVPYHTMCSICHCYKPKHTHHCRICNRCVSRMDHHCPWMNNCIGVANTKHFVLFLSYTWLGSTLSLTLFGVNYFYCRQNDALKDDEEAACASLGPVELFLVRVMTLVCVGALLFTTSMLSSVIYGIYTGIGTIDRLKKRATNTWHETTEEAIPLKDIFGVGTRWLWWLPTDPDFDNYDRVMGYATRQRLLRQEQMCQQP